MLKFHDTHCCGVKEIADLSQHKTAEDAMKHFCKTAFGEVTKYHWQVSQYRELYTFYFFTAGVYTTRDRKTYVERYKSLGRQYERYGHEFAAFIRKHKLGTVWTTGEKINKAFHPDHSNKVWVWNPDRAALTTWWEAHNPKPEEVKAPEVKITAQPLQPMAWAQDVIKGNVNDLGRNKFRGLGPGAGQACPNPLDR